FGHKFLWKTSIDFILDSLESELHGAFEYPKIYCYLLLRLSRILMITMTSYDRSEDVDDLDLVVFGVSCCASLASRSSPLIHQRVAWLQWSVSMVLALPKVSGSKEAPVLCVDDQSGLFL